MWPECAFEQGEEARRDPEVVLLREPVTWDYSSGAGSS